MTAWSYDQIAELYDEDMGRNVALDDLRGYLSLLPPPPATILEIGCGTGRLTRPLAALGYGVLAVDRSVPMLQQLNRKLVSDRRGVATVAMDARRLAIRGTVDAVLFGYCGFQYLIRDDEVTAFCQGLRSLLHPKSILVMDIFIHDPGVVSQRLRRDYRRRMHNGGTLARWKRVTPLGDRVNRIERRYVIDDGSIIRTVSEQRWYHPPELRSILRHNGFRIVGELWNHGLAADSHPRFLTVAATADRQGLERLD